MPQKNNCIIRLAVDFDDEFILMYVYISEVLYSSLINLWKMFQFLKIVNNEVVNIVSNVSNMQKKVTSYFNMFRDIWIQTA